MTLERRCALAKVLVQEAAEMLRRLSVTTGAVRIWFDSRAGHQLFNADEDCEAVTAVEGLQLFWGGRIPTRYSLAFTVGSASVAERPAAVQNSRAAQAELARLKGYVGDPCSSCGNFTLVRNGTCLKCDTCGTTTGCS